MAELDPLTLNVADIFTGVALPTDSCEVVVNADLAYRLRDVTKALDVAQAAGDTEAASALEAERDGIFEKAKEFTFRFDVQAIPRHIRDVILNEEMTRDPVKVDLLGREEPNAVRDEAITVRIWAASIRRITKVATGAAMTPVAADVAAVRGQFPDPAILKINDTINGLYTGTNEGYESLAQGHDFLSQP